MHVRHDRGLAKLALRHNLLVGIILALAARVGRDLLQLFVAHRPLDFGLLLVVRFAVAQCAVLLGADQGARDDAVDGRGAVAGDKRLGDFAHDAHGAAAVDELVVGIGERVGEDAGGFEVEGFLAGGGAAEDADDGVFGGDHAGQ